MAILVGPPFLKKKWCAMLEFSLEILEKVEELPNYILEK